MINRIPYFQITAEGEPIKNGFNFYSKNDKHSFGFRFRFSTKSNYYIWYCRYSTYAKKWIFDLNLSNRNKSDELLKEITNAR